MKLFEVKAKCGHVGKNFFTLKTFAVKAENGKEAALIVRNMPRVKHHHKDAIRSVFEISIERFQELCKSNSEDPYFLCKNIQEHKQYVLECEVFEEKIAERKEKEEIKKPIYVGKELLRNPKRCFKNYIFNDMRYAI